MVIVHDYPLVGVYPCPQGLYTLPATPSAQRHHPIVTGTDRDEAGGGERAAGGGRERSGSAR
ncbi:hypothetical protein, partial [Streptomyces sp. SID3343]|uniref:hypothetical protein n=1 Tax=Streptomyces sp. SID3343 TaxID=2690260 RepID=UPI001F47DC00